MPDYPDQGGLFVNQKKTGNQPDMTGYINVSRELIGKLAQAINASGGQEVRVEVAAWTKASRDQSKPPWQSVKVQMDDRQGQQPVHQPQAQQPYQQPYAPPQQQAAPLPQYAQPVPQQGGYPHAQPGYPQQPPQGQPQQPMPQQQAYAPQQPVHQPQQGVNKYQNPQVDPELDDEIPWN